VSNGSSARSLGSFGWSLATPAGQRLAECYGLVYGNDPSSFRSEATGLLAILLFLLNIRVFFDVTLDCSLSLYTDNKGLVSVLPAMAQPFQSPLASFRADWDLLQALASTIKQISTVPVTVHHVKGHQDRARTVASLSLPAQLNVEADSLATDFNAALTHPLPVIPFDPATRILLTIGQKTVTSHIRSQIRYQMHHHPLADLIRQRYKWTVPVFRSVDFKSGGLIYRSFYEHQSSLTKFIHEQLPTAAYHIESPMFTMPAVTDAATPMRTPSTFSSARQRRASSGGNPFLAPSERHTPRPHRPTSTTYSYSTCKSS
jgi:hypothetical protein